MMEYPKERVYMMRKEVEYQKLKRNEAEKHYDVNQARIHKLETDVHELSQMLKSLADLRKAVYC